MVGRTLSHYRVVERLGAGGMGEVYRAHDDKLDRDVALKVLPEGALADDAARSRFRKEAHALSRLSHPHVAHLLDFDSEDGVDFLLMELVTGPSLEEVLRPGPLPEKDVLRLGSQLARGLRAAHDQGVVHRDLKPSNLALTPDGLLKIFDFGLARLVNPKPANPGHTTATETAAGAVAGSPPYMAPEQLLGKPPDARTDLYSAGAVLYELATGRRPFGSRSGVALTDAILHEPPSPPRSLQAALSPGLEAVILKALDKDPELRHQTAKDLLVDLERLQAPSDPRSSERGASFDRRPVWQRAPALLGVGVVLLVVVGGGAWLVRPGLPPRITGVRPLATRTAPSPWGNDVLTDGERVYYLSAERDQVTLHQVSGTGGEVVDIPLPFRDPALLLGTIPGESALLVGGSQTEPLSIEPGEGWPLWRVPVPAGAPQRVGDLLAVSADGSPDGRSLALMRNRSIAVASLDGSELRELCRLEGPGNRIRWSPDGTRIRFNSRGPGSRSEQWIWEISATGGSPRPLWPGHQGAWVGGRHYVFDRPPTHDLFVATESWWAPWWPSRPQQLTSGPLSYGCYGASRDGRRLFAGFAPRQPPGGGTLMRYDQEARLFAPALGGESAMYAHPSPDGQWLAWVRFPEGTLWRSRPDGSERLQLTRLPAVAHLPRWSPDGTRLAFASRADPSKPDTEIRVVTADGSKNDLIARPSVSAGALWDPCWLPDDSILFSHQAAPSGLLRFDPLTHRVEPVPGAARLQYPKCSLQGDVLATSNDEQGARWKLRRSGTAEWRDLGPSQGAYPSWTRDGRSVCSLSQPSHRIDCLRLDTGRVDPITDTSTVQLAVWVVVPWMGLDAQDRPLVTATTTRSTNLYALDWEP